MSGERKKAKRRDKGARPSLLEPRKVLPIVLVAIVVVVLRTLAGGALQKERVLSTPVLEDRTYVTAIQQIQSTDFDEPVLPRGSVLYPRLVGWLPGMAEGSVKSLPLFQGILEGLAVLLLGVWVASRWGVLPALLGGLLYALDPVGAFFAARVAPTSAVTLLFAAGVVLLDGSAGCWKRSPLGSLTFGVVAALGFLLSPLLFAVLALVGGYRRWTVPAPDAELPGDAPGNRAGQPDGPTPGLGLRLTGLGLAVLPLVVALALVSMNHSSLRDGGLALSWGTGYSVYNATNAETGGTSRLLAPPQWRTDGAIRSDVWEAIAKEGSSYDVYRFYLARGLQRLVERPIEFLGVVLVKVAASLGVSPLPDTGPSPTFVLERAGGALALGRWSFALFLGLGIAGWLAAPRGPIRRGVSLGLLAVAATSILGTTSAAARQPGVLLLAMASGGFLASLAGTLEGGRARSALPLIALPVALGLSFVLGQLSPTAALLNPSEDYRLAGILAISASPREAIPLLERSVRTNPQNAEAHASLARAYQREGLTENAMREFRAAFDADSTNATVLLGLASVEQEQQNAGRALDLVSRLVNQHPNNPLYLNEAARMFIQSGRWDIAKPLLLRALEIKPDYRTAQTNLEAVTQAELEAERSLIPDEMRLPADDPLNTTLGQIGRALQQGDSAMADSLITEIEQQRPDHVLPHWMRAAWLARTGDLGGATRALETCNRLAPCRPAIAGQLAQIYVQLGREADAKRLLDGCIATPPSPEMGRRLEQVRTELLGS